MDDRDGEITATIETDPLPGVCSDRGNGVRTTLHDPGLANPGEYIHRRAEGLIQELFFSPEQARGLGHDLPPADEPVSVSVTFSETFREKTGFTDGNLSSAETSLNQRFSTPNLDEGTPAMDVSLRFGP